MTKTLPFLALLLMAAPALAARSIVAEATVDGVAITRPVIVPVNHGTHELGDIVASGVTLCFKDPASPAGVCDRSGKVQLLENLGGQFRQLGAFRYRLNTSVSTPVNFPVNLLAGQRLDVATQFIPKMVGSASDNLVLRGTPTGGIADNITFAYTGGGMPSGPCLQGPQKICLDDDRFKVQTSWRTDFGSRGFGSRVSVPSDDSGLFYFFNPNNWEMLLKVLNGCGVNNRFWVFSAATTNVEYTISVTDTQQQKVKTYFNPLGDPAAPVQDTQAFATCP